MLLLLACANPIDSAPTSEPHTPTIQVDAGDCNHAPDLPYLGGGVLVTTCTPDGRCTGAQQWILADGRIHLASCTGGTSWTVTQLLP